MRSGLGLAGKKKKTTISSPSSEGDRIVRENLGLSSLGDCRAVP